MASIHSISQENKLGKRFIEASDFLKSGIPASLLALIVSASSSRLVRSGIRLKFSLSIAS